MVRISKQSERRAESRRRPRAPSEKTGPKKEKHFNDHANALEGDAAVVAFIPKIR